MKTWLAFGAGALLGMVAMATTSIRSKPLGDNPAQGIHAPRDETFRLPAYAPEPKVRGKPISETDNVAEHNLLTPSPLRR